MSKTLDAARMPRLSDKYREQEAPKKKVTSKKKKK